MLYDKLTRRCSIANGALLGKALSLIVLALARRSQLRAIIMTQVMLLQKRKLMDLLADPPLSSSMAYAKRGTRQPTNSFHHFSIYFVRL